jgi:two-component system chemotaxis sensor kinase CheA
VIDDPELLQEFLIESFENLDRLDQDFIDLEQDPASREILASIFRTVHTIKGTSGFLGFDKLQGVTHVGENLLGKLRDGQMAVSEEITSGLLSLVDAVREMLSAIEGAGNEGNGDYSPLVGVLTDLQDGARSTVAEDVVLPPEDQETIELELEAGRLGTLLVETGLCTKAAVVSALKAQILGDERRLGEILIERGLMSANQLLEVLGEITTKSNIGNPTLVGLHPKASETDPEPLDRKPDEAKTEGGRSVADSSVRVDVALLDGLIDLVGELVLARNQLVQLTGSRGSKGNPTATASQRVSMLTSELQERVMKTRMQPINVAWNKLPRVVRDLAVTCGKQVRVEMEGQDTELDKTIIEAIRDPLTHIVRNSVDHGIERAEVREGNGKNPQGMLKLRAFHEGGKVVIEIIDDGGGIDPDKVKAKALEKNVITADQAASMSDQEAVNLIFAPGFSTAAQVTNVSGRGVGMDVVRTNIEKIGGTVDVQSVVGHGTTLTIRIPLTLAIVPALIVETGGSRFAVPQPNLIELVRIKRPAESLERIDDATVYRLRGQLLPVLDLSGVLGLPDSSGPRSLAVLHVDGIQFGLLVDRVNDAEEIVVKPLGPHLKGVDTFAGCTVMGDGTVALILDIMAIARRARLQVSHETADLTASKETERFESLLICEVGTVRLAVPLPRVSRLEHVNVDQVEQAGRQNVVRYGKTLLPVVDLHDLLGVYADVVPRRLKMIVTNEVDGRSIGIIVDRIVDSIRVPAGTLSVQGATGRFGTAGSGVVGDKLTEVIDIDAVVATVDDSYFSHDLVSIGD